MLTASEEGRKMVLGGRRKRRGSGGGRRRREEGREKEEEGANMRAVMEVRVWSRSGEEEEGWRVGGFRLLVELIKNTIRLKNRIKCSPFFLLDLLHSLPSNPHHPPPSPPTCRSSSRPSPARPSLSTSSLPTPSTTSRDRKSVVEGKSVDRKSTRLNSSHRVASRMPSSA